MSEYSDSQNQSPGPLRMDTREAYMGRILQNPESLHFTELKFIYAAQVIVHAGIRQRCQYSCEYAHQSTLSPPLTASPVDTRRMLDEYRYGLMVRREAPLDTNDIPALWSAFAENMLQFEHESFVRGFPKAFVPAIRSCLFGHHDDSLRPCDYNGKSRPTFEAIGINVGETLGIINWDSHIVRDPHEPFNLLALLLLE